MQQTFIGRVWKLGDDIDTDIIIPTDYLALPGVAEMAPYAFSPLRPELAGQIKPGDIIVAGKNFGCGSSREQAPEIIKALGVACVIAKSYARIFYRNAVNNGLLLLENATLPDAVAEGDTVEVSPGKSVRFAGKEYPLAPMAGNVLDILAAGGLVESVKRNRRDASPSSSAPANAAAPKAHTLIEKVIMRNTGAASVTPGEIVTVKPDAVMIHDIFVPFVADKFEQMGFTRVWDADKAVLIYDHLVPAATADDVRHFKTGDAFAKKVGLRHVHRSDGICHQLMVEQGYVGPGSIAFGTDSHTTTYGAVGAFSTGIGYTEMAAVLGTGELWVRVPATIKVELCGSLPPGVAAKDIILKLIGDIGADGAVYRALEFGGEGAARLSLASRMTIANMAVEAGAKCALFAPDEKALEYWQGEADLAALQPDPGAEYEQVLRYDLSQLTPVAACPSQVDAVRGVAELLGTKVDQVFIGSCTNGRLEDLQAAADILRGRQVAPFVRLIVTPASREVYNQAAAAGLLEDMTRAGAMVTLPGCGLCCGRAGGIMASGEVVLATNNRNFMGRMGDASVQIYLASPAVAAATALKGEIALPE